MPSTTSSTVSADLDSSTVITPSLPTFSIASAIRLPMVLSLLEAMVATWAISFLSLVDLDIFFSSATTASRAGSIPRFLGDGRAAELLVDDDITPPGPHRGLDRHRQDIDSAEQGGPPLVAEHHLLGHREYPPRVFDGMDP